MYGSKTGNNTSFTIVTLQDINDSKDRMIAAATVYIRLV
jgi:hypothetical protein